MILFTLLAALARFAQVERSALRNLPQPGTQALHVLASLDLGRQREEGRLGSILSVVGVLGHLLADAVDHAGVQAHDLLERLLGAAGLELSQQSLAGSIGHDVSLLNLRQRRNS